MSNLDIASSFTNACGPGEKNPVKAFYVVLKYTIH